MSPKVRQAVAKAAAETGILPQDIMNMAIKLKPVTRARWRAWSQLRYEHGWSLLKIAQQWNCDHTSVLYGTIKQEMENDSRKTAPATQA